MANQISGRVIAVSKVQTVASADPSKAPLKKREIYIDCTRYDPYTGERSQYENKPLLEFVSDRTLEKVNPVLDSILRELLEDFCNPETLVVPGVDDKVVKDVLRRVAGAEFKRHQSAPTLKLSSSTLGIDWHMPAVAKIQ